MCGKSGLYPGALYRRPPTSGVVEVLPEPPNWSAEKLEAGGTPTAKPVCLPRHSRNIAMLLSA